MVLFASQPSRQRTSNQKCRVAPAIKLGGKFVRTRAICYPSRLYREASEQERPERRERFCRRGADGEFRSTNDGVIRE